MKIIIEWSGKDKQPTKLLEMAMEYASKHGMEYELSIAGELGSLYVNPIVEYTIHAKES